jgi:diguanylate cyclase (GGDEF)-like protein
MPMLINYAISLIIGRGNIKIKYGIVLGYLVFYTYTMITSQSLGTFCYIFPMMCALLMYDDMQLSDIMCGVSFIVNLVCIAYDIFEKGETITAELITFYEIQMACLILCTIFLHKTSKVLIYGNNKLNKLNDEISRDELTGVHNRYFLTNYTADKFKTTNIGEITLAVIDIDNFKGINDTYGHKFGDLVLRKIAGILKSKASDADDTHVVRIGGDEFAIISSVITKEMMGDICTKACDKIASTKLKYGNKDVSFTVSIGVASTVDENCTTYNELYEAADQMLYTVKTNGKCSVAITA